MKTIYRYTLRPQSALIQWILSILVAGILIYYFSNFSMPGGGTMSQVLHIVIVGIALIACFITIFGYMPRRILTDDENVQIRMTVAKRIIPKKDIVRVRRIDPSILNGSVRTYGIGGIGFSSAQYRNSSLGDFLLYMTKDENLILIETSQGMNIVTNYEGDLGEFLS